MASDGPNSGGTFASSPPGAQVWGTPSNASSSDDSRTVSQLGGPTTTETLIVTNFSFVITDGAAINGIEVTVEKRSSASPLLDAEDIEVFLVVGGTIQSGADNKATGGDWGGSDITTTYGGSTDTWGVSLSESDVEASNFGLAFRAEGFTGLQAEVDHVTMTVYFTAGMTSELVPGMEKPRVARTHEPVFAYEW